MAIANLTVGVCLKMARTPCIWMLCMSMTLVRGKRRRRDTVRVLVGLITSNVSFWHRADVLYWHIVPGVVPVNVRVGSTFPLSTPASVPTWCVHIVRSNVSLTCVR